jgi:hypothetical protein
MPSSNYSNEKQYVLFHLSAALPQAQKHLDDLDESFSLLASGGGSPADGFPTDGSFNPLNWSSK